MKGQTDAGSKEIRVNDVAKSVKKTGRKYSSHWCRV